MSLFVAAVLIAARVAYGQAPQPERLQAALQGLAQQLSDGIARFTNATVESGKRGTAFENDVVALVGLTSWAGGNGSKQYLAIFEHHDPADTISDKIVPYQLLAVVPVGDDSKRWFQTIQLRDDRVVLQGRRWLPSDAHCCPSADAQAVYRFNAKGLFEVEP